MISFWGLLSKVFSLDLYFIVLPALGTINMTTQLAYPYIIIMLQLTGMVNILYIHHLNQCQTVNLKPLAPVNG